MLAIELTLSVVTLSCVWMLKEGYKRQGAIVGALSQLGWIALFAYTGQYGLLPYEVTLISIYIKELCNVRLHS